MVFEVIYMKWNLIKSKYSVVINVITYRQNNLSVVVFVRCFDQKVLLFKNSSIKIIILLSLRKKKITYLTTAFSSFKITLSVFIF